MHRHSSTFAVFTSMVLTFGWTSFSMAQEAVPGEYLIKFKASVGPVGMQKLREKLAEKGTLKAQFGHLGVSHISLKPDVDPQEFARDPEVEYIEPNFILSKSEVPLGEIVESFSREEMSSKSLQEGLGFTQSGSSAFRTSVAGTWPSLKPLSSGKITVAVIDTGADRTHFLFKSAKPGCNVSNPADYNFGNAALWVNASEVAGNGRDDDGNGFIDDVNGFNFISNSGNVFDDDGHGTHVAGTVVGTAVDIINSCDESPIQIMPLKFLDANGSGSTSNAIRAMYYAVQNGAKVINNSWGGSSYSRSLHDAMAFAYNHDVVVVSAAGNSSLNNDAGAMYPANYDTPSNIAVAAVENNNTLAYFSNYGKYKVAVAAPGVQVYSSIPMNMGAFGNSSGTSMAAPFVAGVAALVIRENSNLNSIDVKDILIQNSDTYASQLGSYVYSSGVVSLSRSISAAQNLVSTLSLKADLPSYTPTYLSERSPASAEEKAVGGCGLVGDVGKGGSGGMGMMVGLLLLPLAAWMYLRQKAQSPESRRRFDRFKMNSEVKLQVGDRELVGQVNTISQGGVSFNVDQALEKGGVVTMRITSPDGHEVVEVQGHIVWSEKNQAYGVQFDEARDGVVAMIRDWTQSLMKA